MIVWQGQLITPEQILEMARTEAGRKEVKRYILQARMAYGVQALFQVLSLVPDAKDQQRACQTLYDCLFRVPIEDVMAWAQSVAVGLEANEVIGNC